MASFFPLLSELLPMIVPASTRIVHAQSLPASSGPDFAHEQQALVGVSDKMCASDVIVFAQSGHVTLSVHDDTRDDVTKHLLGPGDFAFIPAWTEHRAENEGDVDAKWVMIQSGARPVGVELSDWSGDEVAARG